MKTLHEMPSNDPRSTEEAISPTHGNIEKGIAEAELYANRSRAIGVTTFEALAQEDKTEVPQAGKKGVPKKTDHWTSLGGENKKRDADYN